jgi:hypothetical protein
MGKIDKAWAEDFFQLARQARQQSNQQSTTDAMLTTVDLAVTAITQSKQAPALLALRELKRALGLVRHLLDDAGEREFKAAMDYMTMRKQNLELQLMIAKLTGAEQAAVDIRAWIDEIAPFFDAAISDLDPDQH